MDANTTKQSFAEICERIWKKILSEEKMDVESAWSMCDFVTHLVMVSWNACVNSDELDDAKDIALHYASEYYDEDQNVVDALLNAASIKWYDYGDDDSIIEETDFGMVNEKPRGIAYLRGEYIDKDLASNSIERLQMSPGFQRDMKYVSTAKRKEAFEEIKAEYYDLVHGKNECSVVLENEVDQDSFGEKLERLYDYPLERATLDHMYNRILKESPLDSNRYTIRELLQENPSLVPACMDYRENFRQNERARIETKTKGVPFSYPGSVAELAIAIEAVYAITAGGFWRITPSLIMKERNVADSLVSQFLRSKPRFQEKIRKMKEPNLIKFICENVVKLKLPPKEEKNAMGALLAWGLAIGDIRKKRKPMDYPDEGDDD